MVMQYDYESKHSRDAMKKITRFLVGRWGKGATQSQIALKTGMTTPTVSRYLKYLMEQNEVHEAGKTDSARGGKAVLYKPGPNPNPPPPRRPKREYTDLPLAFFGVQTK
jgi:hypothetical protein